MSTAPFSTKVLNLDDLQTPESDIKIVHKGVTHPMRTLTVDAFIAQQKRAAEHQRMLAAKEAAGDEADDGDMVGVIQLIRDSIVEFFPTLPVNELETPKMFMIFGWLNEMSAEINGTESADVVESAEGNVEPAVTPES